MSIRLSLGMMLLILFAAKQALGQQETGKPAGATGGTVARQDEASDDAENPQKLMDEALKKARARDLEGAAELLRKAYALDPENEQIGLRLVSILQSHGLQVARGDRMAANKYMYEAAKVASKLLDANRDMPSRQRSSLTIAIYNEACCYSVEGKFDQALKSLDRAFRLGFTDFEQIAKDEDFDKLRQRDEFAKLVAKNYEAYRLKLVDELTTAIEAHEPYDFEFRLTSTEGATISNTDFKGKVLIADIWGTWCPPCRAEIPHFIRLRQEHGPQGLEIVGLNYERGDDDEAKIQKIKAFMEEQGMNYPCVLGDDATRKQVPGFRGYPTTVFIDRSGDVRLTLVGLQPYDKLETAVELLLEE